jgi:16S rRNA (cytidine1402-2'-O)-methyltransferase
LSGEGPAGPRLAVVATPIGHVDDLSRRAIDVLSHSQLILCEDTRHTGMLLSRVGVERDRLLSLNAHNENERIPLVIEALSRGDAVALVSDAGTPLVSDPGARLVVAVIEAGFRVVAVPGPSAVLAALVVSGFDTDRFAFFGFLPRSGSDRKARLVEIADADVTSVIYESPRRVAGTLVDLATLTGPDRRVVIARELTKRFEETWRGPLAAAIERVRSVEPIGEHVLVVEGRRARMDVAPAQVREALSRLTAAGLSGRDAAKAVEILLCVPHRLVYAAGLALDAASKGGDAGNANPRQKGDRVRTVR